MINIIDYDDLGGIYISNYVLHFGQTKTGLVEFTNLGRCFT